MQTEAKKILEFVTALEGLKKIERFKEQIFWKDYPFPKRYESVADHTWRLAVMLIAVEKYLSQPLDLAKALTMALIHDIPEIITGDASPLGTDGTGQDSHAYNAEAAGKKHEAEKLAAKEIFNRLPQPHGDDLYRLWLEYEEQKSFEAQVVKALDKIEGKLQALEYSQGNVFKKHLDFNIKYGVETYDVDPLIQEIGAKLGEEFRQKFKEFSSISESFSPKDL